MHSSLHGDDRVAWSNYYFEPCFLIMGLNLALLYFYNAMARKARITDRVAW